jgi:hypothetical protein
MKLTVKRFRTRRIELPPPPPPRPAKTARAGVGPQGPGDDAFMPGPDADGFGASTFGTAGGPMARPGSPEAAPTEIDAIRLEGLKFDQVSTCLGDNSLNIFDDLFSLLFYCCHNNFADRRIDRNLSCHKH